MRKIIFSGALMLTVGFASAKNNSTTINNVTTETAIITAVKNNAELQEKWNTLDVEQKTLVISMIDKKSNEMSSSEEEDGAGCWAMGKAAEAIMRKYKANREIAETVAALIESACDFFLDI